jgi:hypothetical protein
MALENNSQIYMKDNKHFQHGADLTSHFIKTITTMHRMPEQNTDVTSLLINGVFMT